jgi:hypothetical protein
MDGARSPLSRCANSLQDARLQGSSLRTRTTRFAITLDYRLHGDRCLQFGVSEVQVSTCRRETARRRHGPDKRGSHVGSLFKKTATQPPEKRFVERRGGRVVAESVKNAGTTVRMFFPCSCDNVKPRRLAAEDGE